MTGIDPQLLAALQNASSQDLIQLRAMIDRVLSDPARILDVAKRLHVGQMVHFRDPRTGTLRPGKIAALHDTQADVLEGQHVRTRVPYVAIVPPDSAPVTEVDVPAVRPPDRGDFSPGDRVSFEDRHLRTLLGTIRRINARTATVDTGDGGSWRVSFALLRRVVDV